MNPMIPSLHGSKMSSSQPPDTKIMFLDDVKAIENKVLEAPWHGLDTAENGILSLVKNVLMPVAQLHLEQQTAMGTMDVNGVGYTNGDTPVEASAARGAAFTVEVDGKCRTFSSYSDIEKSLANGSIQPHAIRTAVAKGVNNLLDHIRKMYKDDPEWQAVDKLAYPVTI